jgi:FtsP/CotA-like multicopper oxidase with cupredoxin domain
MVSLLVFSDGVGVLFTHFDVKRVEDVTASDFVATMEETCEILGEMSNKEYLALRSIMGTMPHLNLVFEELGIYHKEHKVPAKVLKSI